MKICALGIKLPLDEDYLDPVTILEVITEDIDNVSKVLNGLPGKTKGKVEKCLIDL
jgi:hypothetical protein